MTRFARAVDAPATNGSGRPVEIGTRTQLFVDDHIVADSANVQRVLHPATKANDGQPVRFEHQTMTSAPAANGQVTILNYQKVGPQLYFDAAGFLGRTVGLQPFAK